MIEVPEERQPDARFMDYVDALKSGDIRRLVEIRLENLGDTELETRFATAERIHGETLALYEQEIKILRMEAEGYQAVAEGQDDFADAETTGDIEARVRADQRMRRGLKKVEWAVKARKTHTEIELPKLSTVSIQKALDSAAADGSI